MAAPRPVSTGRDARPSPSRGATVAGVELTAGLVHVVIGHAEGTRLRITGRSDAQVVESAVAAGLVTDRRAVSDALRAGFAVAERTERAEQVAVAIDADDVRTYQVLTTFSREDLSHAVASGEEVRAVREAAAEAVKQATAASEEDPSLRGVATARLDEDLAGLALDGRTLASLVGHRGRLVEVWTDVTIAPLVVTGATTATLEAVRRRGRVVSGAYALGRLLASSGVTDAGVVRLSSDTTSVAILRESRVVATRVFGLGRLAIAARSESAAADGDVWAECVIASLRGHDVPLPGRWLFAGIPDTMLALPAALASAVSTVRGDAVETSPLTPAIATRVFSDAGLRQDDLVAAGAAAIAAGIYVS